MSRSRSTPADAADSGSDSLRWTEDSQQHTALWRSEGGWPAPERVSIADDRTTAEAAFRLASAGTALLWRGDFNNARQLLGALARRIDRRTRTRTRASDLTTAFRQHRTEAAQRARVLGMLLVPLTADYAIPLRRAPDVRQAATEAWGPATGPVVTSLRELVGVIGAHEWRSTGVEIPALGERIHPHYGVFSPVRGEYLDLVAAAPLPAMSTAFDIGTGTGVLSAILARRGIRHVVATDLDARALRCAQDNITRLGLAGQVDIVEADLFPPGRASVVVCNPPWIPAEAATSSDHAVYDPDSRMLNGFLAGLHEHLEPGGEGWLILSDIAERLGLRSRGELLDLIEAAGLHVVARMDIRPTHRRASDASDPLHTARATEVTSLWRLATTS
jgi:SAM-dependent methyltransferase